MSDQQAIAIMATILLAAGKGAYEAPTPIDGAVLTATQIWAVVCQQSLGSFRRPKVDQSISADVQARR